MIYNVRMMSERINVVRVPCVVRWIPVRILRASNIHFDKFIIVSHTSHVNGTTPQIDTIAIYRNSPCQIMFRSEHQCGVPASETKGRSAQPTCVISLHYEWIGPLTSAAQLHRHKHNHIPVSIALIKFTGLLLFDLSMTDQINDI